MSYVQAFTWVTCVDTQCHVVFHAYSRSSFVQQTGCSTVQQHQSCPEAYIAMQQTLLHQQLAAFDKAACMLQLTGFRSLLVAQTCNTYVLGFTPLSADLVCTPKSCFRYVCNI